MRLSTHTFAGMANALTRKEPPHENQPELMTRAERRRAARKARAVKTWKKVAAGTVAVATLFGGMGVASTALAADRDSYQDTIGNSSFEAARNQYGLTKHMKNGAILHAWMWSFKTITQHMPEIAAAGYTSVQTEPMSKIKEVAANGKKFTENWYYVYQPANTSIGNFVVGTEADLKEMTATAHKYGVRVIVDVVANHFTSDWNAIDPDWQNKVKQAQLDGDKKLNDYKFEQAVESAINNAGAADLVSVKANIDMSKVSQTEDGSITGLDEQLAELKQSKPFLFKSEEEPKKKLDLGGPTGGAKAKSGSNLKSAVEDYYKK